jgi:hypothetical protein
MENGRPLAEGMLEKMFETTKLEKEKDINKNSLGLLDLFRFKSLLISLTVKLQFSLASSISLQHLKYKLKQTDPPQ